jgi:hypothetical protein
MGASEAFWHLDETAGRSSAERLGRCPQAALPHRLDGARLQHHLQRSSQPLAGRLFLMPSDAVAVALDLGGTLLDTPPFEIAPGAVDHHHLFVHGLVGANTKVGQAQAGVQVNMVDLA